MKNLLINFTEWPLEENLSLVKSMCNLELIMRSISTTRRRKKNTVKKKKYLGLIDAEMS